MKNKQTSLESQSSNLSARKADPPQTQAANGLVQPDIESQSKEKDGGHDSAIKDKSRLDNNNSKINVLIHSSQVSNISGVGQLSSVMRNSNTSKEKSTAGPVGDFEKSRELASFLGVS